MNVPADRIAVRVDSLLGMTAAVRHGMGTGLLLCLLAEGHGELVRLAGPFEALDTQVWILTHPDLKTVARIRTLTDFLYERLAHRISPTLISAPGSAAAADRRATQ